MTDTAISVQGLGKNYIIGHKKQGDFRHSIGDKLKGIFKPNASEKEVFWALKDIDFEIKHGEAVGIIGRNGAGKSTLLKILSRITDPSTGRFEINGRVSSLLEVGTGFHMELTGRENIFLNGTILGMKRAEIKQKFDEIVDFSGVEKFLDTPVKHYSSGMKVRLAFSVAAHLEPEILIVDEVLAVGDAEFQKKCLGKMDQVSKNEGRTVLFVSHNMGAVQSLCSRGLIIDQGNMILSSDILNAVREYQKRNSSYSEISINHRNDRTGSAECVVTDIKLFDRETKLELSEISSGQSFFFEVFYSSKVEIQNLTLGLIIKNSSDQFMTVFNNGMIGKIFYDLPKNGSIKCIINRNPLMHGEHIVDFNLFINGKLSDSIISAKKFTVSNADYYESGYPNANGRQGIYIDQDWTFQ